MLQYESYTEFVQMCKKMFWFSAKFILKIKKT